MKKFGIAAALLLPWMLQYTLVVPTVWAWRLALRLLGGLGTVVLLLLFPIGWAILLYRRSGRNAERRHQETLAAMTGETRGKTYTTPWGLDWVKAA